MDDLDRIARVRLEVASSESPMTLGNRALWQKIVEIEDQQYPCSNRDHLSVRLIQAVLIPSYPPSAGRKAGPYCIMFIVLCGGVCAQDGKARYEQRTNIYLL
jgi:hypothetical protein